MAQGIRQEIPVEAPSFRGGTEKVALGITKEAGSQGL